MKASILKLSPFKIGGLVVLAAVLLHFSFGSQKPALLDSIDSRITDAMFRWRGPVATTGKVVIVDLDEKSLRAVGQWPWPRDSVARLIERIHQAKPRATGVDIVFAEEDRTSPKRYLDLFGQLWRDHGTAWDPERFRHDPALDHDLALGRAVAAGPTVLGYAFQMTDDGLKIPSEMPFSSADIQIEPPEVAYADLALFQGYRAIVNVPAIAQAESEGFFNVFPDPTGTIRKVPLCMAVDGIPYPSLALELLRLGLDQPGFLIHASRQVSPSRRSVLGVTLGDRFIPTDDRGQMTINFRGPPRTFTYVSAVDVLQGEVPQQVLADKYVLLGTTATGLLDLRATPFSSVFPGVEVQATLVDNILAGDPYSHDIFTEIGITYALIIVGGLLLAALLAYTGPLVGAAGGLLILGATIAGNYHLFFLNHQMVGMVYPLAALLAVFLTVTLCNYFLEGREKRFIHRAFGRYVSPQVVNELIRNPEGLALKGEQKELTVLFSDIRGFTAISERMDSEALGRFMNEYLTAMSNIIMEEKGMVDKFIGDAIMAIWGAPLPDREHAVSAVRASLRMLAALEKLQPVWERRGLPRIDIGIGINSGIMSVGNFGSEGRFDYTVIGDNVNLASRLEGSNKLYATSIIISETTRAALPPAFFCRFLDRIRVKGRQQPVAIYEPLLEGSPPADLREEALLFEEAAGLYQAGNIEAAEPMIQELHRRRPRKLYALYLERIAACPGGKPPPDWDGCFTLTEK